MSTEQVANQPSLPEPLRSVKAKLERARHHLTDLDGQVEATLTGGGDFAWGLHVSGDLELGVIRVTWLGDPQVPALWSVVIGEILYNLRSALDHLAEQLVIVSGGAAGDPDTGFPIFKNERAYAKRAPVRTADMTPAIRAVIEQSQPFREKPAAPADNPLWLVHELCNIDKHRGLHLAEFHAYIAKLEVAGAMHLLKQVPIRFPVRLQHDAELLHYRFDPAAWRAHFGDREVHLEPQVGFDVGLSEVSAVFEDVGPKPRPGALALLTLARATNHVEAVVARFTGFFPS